METIWKYELKTTDYQKIEIPKNSTFLSLQPQFETPCVWFFIPDTSEETETVEFFTFGTGHEVSAPPDTQWIYLGTYQSAHGHFVGHVFMVQ